MTSVKTKELREPPPRTTQNCLARAHPEVFQTLRAPETLFELRTAWQFPIHSLPAKHRSTPKKGIWTPFYYGQVKTKN